ncbi:MAG: CocE/NonD family hydrolase [Myxococcales bacterium]|nr:CocE/NonD family hydrolase [Myxococcales bacterium]
MRSLRPRPLAIVIVAAAFTLAGCGGMEVSDGNARFQVRESISQIHITHADPGAMLAVFDAADHEVQAGTADKLGSLIFRRVPPASGYRVKVKQSTPPEFSRALTVTALEKSTPAQSFYSGQKLAPGYGYIKTRDGTTLSAYITLPGPPEKGPYPTVVDYSGYSPSKPGAPIRKYEFLCDRYPSLCDAPNDSSALLASLFGYATVSVNIRGTGCSGGAYDYFETLQLTDGYDVIETVAAQEWAMHHKVGMVGLSYPGIAQLFVAAQRPPGLAAITPMSVIGDTATTLVPGGILNDGFAISWVSNVLNKADPYGQGWEQARVDGGDGVCKENQLLHAQKVDNVAQAYMTPFYDPVIVDPINPTKFVDRIEVPVFLASAWQDEQTGPFFSTLLDRFTHAPVTRFNVYNGVHVDAYQPAVLAEWKTFLDLYVAKRLPPDDKGVRDLSPILFNQIYKAGLRLPPDRFASHPTYEAARAAYEAEPPIRAVFESGAGDPKELGAPIGTFIKSFAKWPPEGTKAQRWFLRSDGTLADTAPSASESASSSSSFRLDPEAGKRGILAPGGNPWDKIPKYDWKPIPAGSAVTFQSPALAKDLVMLGTGSVDLWIKSTADDADLEVNLTEVRPDGKEMYIQSGWLRASHRKLGEGSTPLWPVPTHLEGDFKPLVPGQWTEVRIAIAGFSHVFRAGSKIRILVDTPGDSRADWRFGLKKFPGEVTHTVAHAKDRPSSIALPVLDGVPSPSPLPPCPSLRGQQCRDYRPYVNEAGK